MTQKQECNFALVEIGENEKAGYWFLQGGDWECKDSTLDQEIFDLAEHYKNVAIVLPIPAQLHFEVLKHE